MKKIKALFAIAFIAFGSMMFTGMLTTVSPEVADNFYQVTLIVGVLGLMASATLKNGIALTAFNVTDLTTALGAYCRKYKDIIISQMLMPEDVYDYFTVADGVKDELALPNIDAGDLVQPMDYVNFDATANAFTMGARILKVRDWKVDLLLYPKDLEKTYYGLLNKPGSDPLQLSIEAFIMQKVIAKIKENIRMNATYQGIYDAGGTGPGDIVNGFAYMLAVAADDGDIDPVVTGAITSSNVVDKLLLVYDNLGEPYKNVATQMFVNSQIFDWYCRKASPLLNAQLVAPGDLTLFNQPRINRVPLVGTNATIIREPGLGSIQTVFVTTKDNMYYGVDSMSDTETIRVQEFNRSLKLMVDGKLGLQFAELRSAAQGNIPLSVNDQLMVVA